jgi:prolipoprotein diacylglyceryltransferase
MADELFVGICALLTFLLYRWAFRHLTRERWQFLAAVPIVKTADAGWQALNLTTYGFFNATAYTLACTLLIVLTAAIGIPVGYTLVVLAIVLGGCMPGSRLIARLVEKKPHTFSIGGAFFLGLLLTPPVVLLSQPLAARYFHTTVNPLAFLAAVSLAYCWGEGIGRLACISFGCCYGKPLQDLHPVVRTLLGRWHFTFFGDTRKIAYAHHLEGVPVVPVQGLTAVLYSVTALAGVYAFLNNAFCTALLLSLIVSQLWRFASEFLRADYRGEGRISAYQVMSLLAVLAAVGLAFMPSPPPPTVSSPILRGLAALWHPAILLVLQGLWIAAFLYTGRSQVTGATIHFHVHRHLT